MTKFHELCGINRKTHLTALSQTLEAQALKLLKAVHGTQTDTYDKWLLTKSSKRPKKNAPEPAEIPFVEEE